MPVSPVGLYPATFGLFEKVTTELTWGTVGADPALPPGIRAYVEKSSAMMNEFAQTIDAQVGVGPVVVWGAGQLSMKLLAGPLAGVEVEAIVDGSDDKWGMQMGGLEVVSPESISSSSSPILVTSIHHFASIAAGIERMYPGRHVIALPVPPATGS
jgi:hypothetical protein